jgi:hypothetical protein
VRFRRGGFGLGPRSGDVVTRFWGWREANEAGVTSMGLTFALQRLCRVDIGDRVVHQRGWWCHQGASAKRQRWEWESAG